MKNQRSLFINISTNVGLLQSTVLNDLVASVVKWLGFMPIIETKDLAYSSIFNISPSPSKLLTQKGSSLIANLSNSFKAAKARFSNIDLSSVKSLLTNFVGRGLDRYFQNQPCFMINHPQHLYH